jgi:hypothetical protein
MDGGKFMSKNLKHLIEVITQRTTGMDRPMTNAHAANAYAHPPQGAPLEAATATDPGGDLYFVLGLSELGGPDVLG